MTDMILQGGELDLDGARQIARNVGGVVQNHGRFFRIMDATGAAQETARRLAEEAGCDINVLPPDFRAENVRLLITDMDSTLINIECVDEIADFVGVKPQVAAITEAAMRGELDFAQSLTKRVGLLAGLEQAVLQQVYDERLRLNPGAETLLAGLRSRGIKVALVSGGFTFFTERLKPRLGLDYTLANVLGVADGRLTGKVDGQIVGAAEKQAFLLSLCDEMGIAPHQAVAMGDGANDLKMLNAAGLGVAYHAKPKVREQADCALNYSGLDGVLGLLGIEI